MARFGKKERNSFEGRITINGERISVYGRTKIAVREKMKTLKMSHLDEQLIHSSAAKECTVEQWLNTWANEWLIQVSDGTKRRYEIDIRLHLIPNLGSKKLKDLQAQNVQKLYNKLFEDGLSAKSVKCLHGVLHEALKKAVELGQIQTNVIERCKLPKQDVYEMRPLRDGEIKQYLVLIKGHRYEDAYFIALFTGMREAELLGLTWDCVDFERKTIRIYRQLQRTNKNGEYYFVRPKNNKARIIRPAAEVMNRLASIRRRELGDQSAYKLKEAEEFVFLDRNGRHLTINMLYKPFKRIVSAMGLSQVRFHDLRHTYALLSLQSGCDIKTLSENLGHATVAFTLDRYGHVSEEMQIRSNVNMQNLIEQMMQV